MLLKVQGAFVPTPHIEVRYDITYQRVYVSTWSSTGGWITHASVAQTFAVGDMLGARAYANGSVEVYRNATKIDPRFGEARYGRGRRASIPSSRQSRPNSNRSSLVSGASGSMPASITAAMCG